MNFIAFILLLVAACCFGIETYLRKSLVALGLCLLTVGLIVEFAAHSHTITF